MDPAWKGARRRREKGSHLLIEIINKEDSKGGVENVLKGRGAWEGVLVPAFRQQSTNEHEQEPTQRTGQVGEGRHRLGKT